MRVLNSRLSTHFASEGRAESVACLVMASDILVDDQERPKALNPLAADRLTEKTGIAFYAKDADTLIRGFNYVAKHKHPEWRIYRPDR